MLPLSTWLIASCGGLLAGVLAGLFGIGGGALIVPVLMLIGAKIHQATALSLFYIVFSSGSGSVSHWRAGNIRLDLIGVLALGASIAALFGVRLSLSLPRQGIAALFAGFMLLVLTMFALKHRLPVAAEAPTGRKAWLAAVLIGALAGFLASLLGVGGGLVMVPLLVLFNGLDLKQATGTSLASVCLIGIASAAEHYAWGELSNSLRAFWAPLMLMSIAGIAGAPLGAELNRRSSERFLRVGFVALCLSIMTYMLWQLFD